MNQQVNKRKIIDDTTDLTVKRAHKMDPQDHENINVPATEEDVTMEENDQQLPPRPSTPPLGMTLSHYNPHTGSYTSSQYNSHREVKSIICNGMTPVYRAPFERWGSCLI